MISAFRMNVQRAIKLIATSLMMMAVGCEPTPSGNPYSSDNDTESGTTDGESGSTDSNSTTNATITSIAALKSLYKGSTTRITTTISISGVVVANDIRGEFEDTIVIDDGDSAIQISISNDPLYYNYPIGSTIVCQCEDLYLGSDYGVIRLGVAATDDDEVVGTIEDDMLRKIYFSGDTSTLEAKVVTVDELSSNLISRLLRFESLKFKTSGVNFCELNPDTGRTISTSHTLYDKWGNELRLFVPYSVEYADAEVPSGWVDMNVILESSTSGVYTLRQTDYGINQSE